jgi:hypothetical protein
LRRYYKVWDKKILKVFHKIPKLNQPLKELISNDLWQEITAIADKEREMKSILENFYSANSN